MTATGYKFLGFLVWQGGRLYVRRRYGDRLPSARTAGATAAGVALVTVGGLALLSSRRSAS